MPILGCGGMIIRCKFPYSPGPEWLRSPASPVTCQTLQGGIPENLTTEEVALYTYAVNLQRK